MSLSWNFFVYSGLISPGLVVYPPWILWWKLPQSVEGVQLVSHFNMPLQGRRVNWSLCLARILVSFVSEAFYYLLCAKLFGSFLILVPERYISADPRDGQLLRCRFCWSENHSFFAKYGFPLTVPMKFTEEEFKAHIETHDPSSRVSQTCPCGIAWGVAVGDHHSLECENCVCGPKELLVSWLTNVFAYDVM